MGGRALGGALGANHLRPSGSHPGHVPSGPSSTSPVPTGGLWRARVSGDRSSVRGRVLPVLSSRGGGTGSRLPPRGEATGGHGLYSRPPGKEQAVSRSTLRAPTARGLSQDGLGSGPHAFPRAKEGATWRGVSQGCGAGDLRPILPSCPCGSRPPPPPPPPGHCREGGPQPRRAWPPPVSRPLWAVLPRKLLGHAHSPHCSGEGRGQPGAGCMVVF